MSNNEEAILEEIREGILGGTIIPMSRRDCVVCDDLGCEFCPHMRKEIRCPSS